MFLPWRGYSDSQRDPAAKASSSLPSLSQCLY